MLPELNRRGFLGVLGAAVAGASAAKASAARDAYPDNFEYRGFPIWWSGWRQLPNQDVETGWWIASVPPNQYGHDLIVSAVGGAVDRISEGFVVDVSHRRGWPMITTRSSVAQRETAKQKAARNLVEHLRDS